MTPPPVYGHIDPNYCFFFGAFPNSLGGGVEALADALRMHFFYVLPLKWMQNSINFHLGSRKPWIQLRCGGSPPSLKEIQEISSKIYNILYKAHLIVHFRLIDKQRGCMEVNLIFLYYIRRLIQLFFAFFLKRLRLFYWLTSET